MSLTRIVKGLALAAFLVALAGAAAPGARAQVTFGEPAATPSIAFGAGAFDVVPSNHPSSETAAELRGEYHFGDVWWILSPFVGAEGTSDGAVYTYFGFGFDVNFTPRWVFTPNVAAGYFERGGGSDLGSFVEFRSGGEFDYRFDDGKKLGLSFHHISNAGLGRLNPGEEEALVVYSVPVP